MGVVYNQRELNFENYGFPQFVFDFARTKNLRESVSKRTDYIQFSRNSIGTYIGSDGLIKTAVANEPRFDHNITTGICNGLLIEEKRTNLATYSQQIDNAAWTKTNVTVNSNAVIAPDGTLTADNLIEGSGSQTSFKLSGAGGGGGTGNALYSLFAKEIPGSEKRYLYFGIALSGGNTNRWAYVIVDLNTGSYVTKVDNIQHTVAAATIKVENYVNGWKRVSAYFSSPLDNKPFNIGLSNTPNPTLTTSNISYTGDGVSGISIWGIQQESGVSFPTSYIPTTTAAVTREADNISSISLPYSASTIVVEAESTINATPILSLNDGTATNEIRLLNHPLAGGSSVVDSFGTAATSAGGSRLYKTTNAISVSSTTANIVTDNGVSGITTISSTNLNQLRIGSAVSGTSFNGTIKKLYYYNTTSSIEKLKDLSKTRETKPLPPTNEPNLTMGVSITSQNTTWNLISTGTVSYDVDWGDGQIETSQTSNTKAHTYVSPGIYKVVVKIRSGSFRPFYNNNSNAQRIVSIFETGTGWSFGSTLSQAFRGATSLVNVQNISLSGVSNLGTVNNSGAWEFCSSLISFPTIDTSSLTAVSNAWSGCTSLTSFPLLNFQNVTYFENTWSGCTSLKSFPLINTSNATSLTGTWNGCSGLTSFPLIDTSKATSLNVAWSGCTSLTNFPLINTSSATSLSSAWRNCSSLTTFPAINTSNVTNFGSGSGQGAWGGCTSITSFPFIDTSKGITFGSAFSGIKVTSFPEIDTSSGVDFTHAWLGCNLLTSFPLLNFQNATNLTNTWNGCSGLTSFPLINTSNVTTMVYTWQGCSGLTSFPLIDTSKVTTLTFGGTNEGTWVGCSGLTSFPALNFSLVTSFQAVWRSCTQLSSFPANMFDATLATNFNLTWNNCALSSQSIENIIVSINTSNRSNGTLDFSGGTNATKSTWTTAANTAYNALIARGWTITFRA